MANQAVSLMLIAVAVALLPAFSRILRIPSTVVEILFGIILGSLFLGGELGGDWLPFLAELGFLLLMFQAGMEINFTMLLGQSRGVFLYQLALFSATVLLSMAASFAMGQGLFFALVLSTTSLGLVLPTLREAGLSRTPMGQTILVAATLADFLTLLGITFYVLWHQYGLSIRFIYPLPLFAAFAAILWAARRWAWWHPETAERLLLTENTEEWGVRLAMALLFVFVGVSEIVHLEPVLGAFMGGCIISFVFREKEILESKISALGFGFLVPLFFINVGMQFNPGNVINPEQLKFMVVLLFSAFAVKMLPLLILPGSGVRGANRAKAGLLMSSRLSLIIAAAAIGVQEGFLSREMKDAVIFLALLTCLLGPVLFRLTAGRSAAKAKTRG
ncbi:MAG: cation:proton antiporter [Desulfovibrionales bacterium]